MRIALVRRGYSPTGGAERYLQRFAAGLIARGHQPLLISAGEWPDAAWAHGPIIRLPGREPRVFADALEARRRDLPCDFLFSLERVWACDAYRAGDGVHAAWLQCRAAAGSAWKAAFRRRQAKHRMMLDLERALFSGGAQQIIVNSRMVAGEIRAHFHTPESRIHLVYNGYDAPEPSAAAPGGPESRAATRARFGIGQDDLLCLFTGSGWERKGLATAVAALRLLDSSRVHLVVAGSGKMRRYYKHPRVHFSGPVQNLEPLWAAADIFVLPTLYDPFSNACLEAARHGLPVVTTTANGFAESIEAGQTGSVCPPDDAPRLAAALDDWSRPGLAAMARAACADHAAPFSVAANVAATIRALFP